MNENELVELERANALKAVLEAMRKANSQFHSLANSVEIRGRNLEFIAENMGEEFAGALKEMGASAAAIVSSIANAPAEQREELLRQWQKQGRAMEPTHNAEYGHNVEMRYDMSLPPGMIGHRHYVNCEKKYCISARGKFRQMNCGQKQCVLGGWTPGDRKAAEEFETN